MLNRFFTLIILVMFSSVSLAAGLDDATQEMDEIIAWFYGIVGVCALGYIMYLVVMAMCDRKEWSEVVFGFAKVAMAGACLIIVPWAWNLFTA